MNWNQPDVRLLFNDAALIMNKLITIINYKRKTNYYVIMNKKKMNMADGEEDDDEDDDDK